MSTINVLVVEANDDFVDTIAGVLESAGYNAHTAVTRDDALQLVELKRTAYNFIVMDHDMPDLNPAEFVAAVRADSPQSMLILISDKDAAKKAHELSIEHYLEKPFDPKEILSQLKTFA